MAGFRLHRSWHATNAVKNESPTLHHAGINTKCRLNRPIRPSDYVFFPAWTDRQYAIVQMRRQFDLVLKRAGLKLIGRGDSRTLYCLRHTAIMEKLLNGDKIDVLSLARNARTSVEMIERFYARHLHGEMVVSKIHSGSIDGRHGFD